MADDAADTFGVAIHVTDAELEFVVHVPSTLAGDWDDPEAFQSLVADVVWERLDREATLEAIAEEVAPGEAVGLGTVTLRADGIVVDASLSPPTDA